MKGKVLWFNQTVFNSFYQSQNRFADGICEACKEVAPFKTKKGRPYLEPHHTRRMADGGPDDPQSVAAVCPNCHQEIHYGVEGAKLNKELISYLNEVEK
jgi:5-methylcytosine-specific restriction protein A